MKTIFVLLTLLISLTAGPVIAQDRPALTIASFSVRPASGKEEALIGEDAIMEFEYANVAGGLARSTVEVEFCVVGTTICRPSSDWRLIEADLAKYPEESAKVTLRRRTTGTRKQDLVYELRITDAQGRKASRKTTEPLRLRIP